MVAFSIAQFRPRFSAGLEYSFGKDSPGLTSRSRRQPSPRPASGITLVDYPDGRIAIRYQGEDLAHRTFDKIRKANQVAAVENKRGSRRYAVTSAGHPTIAHPAGVAHTYSR